MPSMVYLQMHGDGPEQSSWCCYAYEDRPSMAYGQEAHGAAHILDDALSTTQLNLVP